MCDLLKVFWPLNSSVHIPESSGTESRGRPQQVHVPGSDSHWRRGRAVLQQRHWCHAQSQRQASPRGMCQGDAILFYICAMFKKLDLKGKLVSAEDDIYYMNSLKNNKTIMNFLATLLYFWPLNTVIEVSKALSGVTQMRMSSLLNVVQLKILSHFIYDFSCLPVLGFRFLYFYITRHWFSVGNWSLLQGGQGTRDTKPHSGFFPLSCWNKQNIPLINQFIFI